MLFGRLHNLYTCFNSSLEKSGERFSLRLAMLDQVHSRQNGSKPALGPPKATTRQYRQIGQFKIVRLLPGRDIPVRLRIVMISRRHPNANDSLAPLVTLNAQ